MTDLYEQRIHAMKARERNSHSSGLFNLVCDCQELAESQRNADRLAAYKRKRAQFFGPRAVGKYFMRAINDA